MTYRQMYFGRSVEPCGAGDPDVIGATVGIGAHDVRPPSPIVKIAAKVADGANAMLSEDEQRQLSEIGIDLRRLTDAEVNAMAPAMRAAGLDNDGIVREVMALRRSVEAVSMRAYFRPAR